MKITNEELALLDRAVPAPFIGVDMATQNENSAKDIFLRAYKLISDPSRWCQGAQKRVVERRRHAYIQPAIDSFNISPEMKISVQEYIEDCSQFCSIGALKYASGGDIFYGRHWSGAAVEVIDALYAKIRARGLLRDDEFLWTCSFIDRVGLVAQFNDLNSHSQVMAIWRATGEARGWL